MIPFTFHKFHEKQTCVSINGGTFSASSSLSTANGITNTYARWLTRQRTQRENKNSSVRLEENKNDVLNWITEDRITGAGIYILCFFFAVNDEWDHQHTYWLTHKTKDRGEIRTYLSAIHNEFVHLLFDVNVAIRCYWKERCAPYLLCLVRFVHNLTSILLELPMPFVELVEWCKS